MAISVDYKYLFGAADQVPELTNEYTGSLPAKNGTKGIFADIFRYRIWLTMDERTPAAVNAAWYFGCNAYEFTDSGLITSAQFEPSEDGAKAACEWLQAAYDEN